jgi:RNA polymerase sigma-70 factor (ECF subfamily)
MDEIEAFLQELLPHQELLRRLARRFGSDGDDLVQETFMRALAARHGFRAGSNARAWLCRILVNCAITEKRRLARDRRLAERVAQLPVDTNDSRAQALDLDLQAALAALSPQDRRVLELAEIDGMHYREIARTLECPIGTVMSRLHRARRRLRLQVMTEPQRTAA